MIDLTQLTKEILAKFEESIYQEKLSKHAMDGDIVDKLLSTMKHHLNHKHRLFQLIREDYHRDQRSGYDYSLPFIQNVMPRLPTPTNILSPEPASNKSQEEPHTNHSEGPKNPTEPKMEVQDDSQEYVDDLLDYESENNIPNQIIPPTQTPSSNLTQTSTNQTSLALGLKQTPPTLKPDQQPAVTYKNENIPLNGATQTVFKKKDQTPEIKEPTSKTDLKSTEYQPTKYRVPPNTPLKEESEQGESSLNIQYEKEQQQLEQCRIQSRSASCFHITGLYNSKCSRQTDPDRDHMNFHFLLIKTEHQPSEILLYDKKMDLFTAQPNEMLRNIWQNWRLPRSQRQDDADDQNELRRFYELE